MVDTNSIIEGTVKFRDGKKWKWRWCVMRKLSPVADCLHLQLYRDSKDRCKLGHTKASLSLQHFLGVETGFTLDKESNTIAILCQDVTVILAFDTRERLIQWQVKIANNLGEDQQFLIQISSAPPKSKIQPGPARLHVQELRFCLTSGVPPKLHGCWEIAHLRRYGVVDSKFCFEGGSRCGKGEGLHVLVSDQAEDVEKAVRLASQSKLFTRRRTVSRNMSVMDSPSRTTSQSRSGTLSCADSVILHGVNDGSCCCSEEHDSEDFPYACSHRHSPFWPSAESSRVGDLDSNYGCGDTTSVREMPDSVSQIHGDPWSDDRIGRNRSAMERCTSCFSKLGAPTMSRSSTAATCTPGTPLAPPWPMEPAHCCHHGSTTPRPKTAGSLCDRMSMSSHDSSENSEYSVPRLSCFNSSTNTINYKPNSSCGCSNNTCQCPPVRPPKPSGMSYDQTSPSKKKRKPPMPLPETEDPKDKDYVVHTCACHTPHLCHRFSMVKEDFDNPMVGPYENYDVPRPIGTILREGLKSPDSNHILSLSASTADEYYDTPKNIKECLQRLDENGADSNNQFGNYDTPPSAKSLLKPCACVLKYTKKSSVVIQGGESAKTILEGEVARPGDCPCQRVMCWPENIMRLAYCRRGNGVDNSTVSIQKVKLSGEGKMPVVNQRGQVELYATIDRSKKTSRRKSLKADEQDDAKTESDPQDTANQSTVSAELSQNYENIQLASDGLSRTNGTVMKEDAEGSHPNYANIEFAQSLEYYENSRDVLLKAGITKEEIHAIAQQMLACGAGSKMCTKCGHCQPTGHGESLHRGSNSGSQVDPKTSDGTVSTMDGRLDDYMMMEPNQQPGVLPNGKNFPGYIPMSPITGSNSTNNSEINKTDLMKMALSRINNSLSAEKSASIPSLSGPFVDRNKKRHDSEFVRIPGSAMLMMNHSSATNSPYLRRMADCDESKKMHIARRRSNSADSSRYLEDLESVSSTVSTNSRVSSVNSLLSQCELPQEREQEDEEEEEPEERDDLQCFDARDAEPDSDPVIPSASGSSASIQTLVQETQGVDGLGGGSSSSSPSSAVHIRRSSSVPCKGNNRDSSSSNDSGVSIGSLRHRGSDLTEFELPLTTALSSNWRAQRLSTSHAPCMHASLQRRSKSSDPLKEITFQFHRISIHPKSSSAEAEVPVCPAKKGRSSPSSDGVPPVPYMDCTSTSSGTSDMSDYIETLSLSSHSSSDNPDCLRLQATTTLRPRSGKEYQKIDRSLLERDIKVVGRAPSQGIMGPVPEKSECESPSPGYQSMAASP